MRTQRSTGVGTMIMTGAAATILAGMISRRINSGKRSIAMEIAQETAIKAGKTAGDALVKLGKSMGSR